MRKFNPALNRFFLLLCLLLSACSSVSPQSPAATSAPTSTDIPVTPTVAPPQASPTPGVTAQAVEGIPTTATPEPFQPGGLSAPDCSSGGLLRSIEAPEQYVVRFNLCYPDPAFLAKIARPNFGIYPREWLEQTGGGGQGSLLLEKPVGAGPYQVEEWRREAELVFTAFPGYWGEQKARTPTLIFRWGDDPSQRLLELQAGIVDAMDNPASYEYSFVEADPNLELVFRPPTNTLYLGFNSRAAPFDEERIRRAIALALDREKIIAKLFPPGTVAATHFTPCLIPNGCAGQDWYEFNPTRARELLTEVGYTSAFATKLTYQDVVQAYLPQPGLVAEEIKAELNKYLGINVTLEALAPEEFERALSQGQISGLHLSGWYMDYPDVTNFLDTHLGGRRTNQFGTTFDEILVALQGGTLILGDDLRQPYYETANNLIRELVPLAPIAQVPSAAAFKKQVQGMQISPLGLENFSTMEIPGQDTLIWSQGDEPRSLYCADEQDSDSLRACAQVTETLYRYQAGGAGVEPALAENCQPSSDLMTWTCQLRRNVLFHDGTFLDAGDVVMSFIVQWDASHPLHRGNTGEFWYWRSIWGAFLNAP